MKGYLSFNQIKLLILILVPMIIITTYFYIERKEEYKSYIKGTEEIMANILLNEELFIEERLNNPPLILYSDSFDLKELSLSDQYKIEDILIKFVINRLEFGAIGIYSNQRDEIVFHIGKNEVYEDLDLSHFRSSKNKETDYINLNNNLIYITSFESGYIYAYHENIENEPNGQLFLGMLILAIILAIFAAKLVENRTLRRINSLKKDVEAIKNTDELLPVYDDNFSGIATSVNELKEHLHKQQELLHSILDSLPLGIIYYDQNGQVMYVNKTTNQITGFSKEEISDFTLSSNILKSTDNVFWETLRSGQSFLGFESHCPTSYGREIPVMTSTKILYDPSQNIIGTISSFIDVSEQERLRRIEQKSKVMLDHISDGVMMVDNHGVINGFNRGAEIMTGLKASQVIGKKYEDIFIKRKTIFTKLTQTLETKIEYTNYKKEATTEDGRKVYLMITTKLLWDDNGMQIGAMGIYKDITDLEELAQQVQRADKLAVVGELAAGTAHEIRNPLTTIKGFIQLLKSDLEDSNKEDYIKLVLNEINHINEIIGEMLLLAKPAFPKKSLVDINHLIRDIAIFMNAEALLYNVEFNLQISEGIPEIELDDRQIKQVFINVIRNAIQSMKKGGVITIFSRFDEKNKVIEVVFLDQGEGIPEDKLAKIYEPFFTTKADGTGLGIPVSYRIMINHGGDLQIKSALGAGTEVTLFFPISTDDSLEDRKE